MQRALCWSGQDADFEFMLGGRQRAVGVLPGVDTAAAGCRETSGCSHYGRALASTSATDCLRDGTARRSRRFVLGDAADRGQVLPRHSAPTVLERVCRWIRQLRLPTRLWLERRCGRLQASGQDECGRSTKMYRYRRQCLGCGATTTTIVLGQRCRSHHRRRR